MPLQVTVDTERDWKPRTEQKFTLVVNDKVIENVPAQTIEEARRLARLMSQVVTSEEGTIDADACTPATSREVPAWDRNSPLGRVGRRLTVKFDLFDFLDEEPETPPKKTRTRSRTPVTETD